MKRWNGWGDESISAALPAAGLPFLEERIGPGTPPRDATFASVTGAVPPSRLPAAPGITTDPATRLRHARGQSLPDWIALRSGRIDSFPDGVAFPESTEEVGRLLRRARQENWQVIPYGGGTSVAGHINPMPGDRPVLTVSLARLNRLTSFDDQSQLATFHAGVLGPELEARLRSLGYTLGHFPQSFEHSSLGGWIVTRSSGQQSIGFGRIERLFAGGTLETPVGSLTLPCHPASAAGPDVREMVLGSEGRLGIVTEATVRATRLPEREEFHGLFFPAWEAAATALRHVVQARLPLSMLRLSTPEETRTNLVLAGHERAIAALERILAFRGARTEKCLLLVGLTGRARIVRAARRDLLALVKPLGALNVGFLFGNAFKKNRFRAPYLRNELWERGYAVDTLETAAPWSRIPALLAAVESALRDGLSAEKERVHVFTHLSHAYVDGSSLYTTYVFRLAPDPERNLARWRRLKDAASRAIVAHGGTISHQHGVGLDHRPYLAAEKGPLGLALIGALARRCDPDGIMNPGKLLPEEAES